jgi:hypothetical protein
MHTHGSKHLARLSTGLAIGLAEKPIEQFGHLSVNPAAAHVLVLGHGADVAAPDHLETAE